MSKNLWLFLDESGDLGRGGTSHFVLALVATYNPRELRRCIKRVRQRKLKKSLRAAPELKASQTPAEITVKVLKLLSQTQAQIYFLVIPKHKIFDRLHSVRERLYNYLTGLLAELIVVDCDTISLVVDKRNTKKILREDFDKYVGHKLREKLPQTKLTIEHKFSNATPELQLTDFVAWSCLRRWSMNDSRFHDLIASRIVETKTPWGE